MIRTCDTSTLHIIWQKQMLFFSLRTPKMCRYMYKWVSTETCYDKVAGVAAAVSKGMRRGQA